jgi:acetolactate synthase-1/2/3 large subunit
MDGAVTGADLLVQGLIDAGVEHVFGLPGDTGVDLYDALFRASHRLRHIMCRDERHAAIMGDVYARCGNRVGVIEVSSGGGATYCVGGLGEPFAASVPLVVISSDIHTASRNTGALTELDQEKLFSSVTKWVRRTERADDIPALLQEAFAEATSGRPAPVALIVPENLLAENTGTSRAPNGNAALPAWRPAADASDVATVAAALLQAKRPAIVVGGGIHFSQAYTELSRLAELAAVPIATTIHGKGAYPESNGWSLGVVGANGARAYANDYLETADFVLFIGTRANATDTNSYRCPPRSTAVAQIDIDSERAGRNYPNGVRMVADAKSALAALAAELNGRTGERAELRRQLEYLRSAWRSIQIPVTPEGSVHPLTVFGEIRATFGPDTLIVADCGTATPFLAAHWETNTAGRSLLMARGHGPMGYAIPGAVGAALANPGKRVIAVTTDGSFGMACGELETVVRLRLPITFIQLTNGSYGWIKMLQHLYHEGRYFGVDIARVDVPAITAGFGLHSTRVASQTALQQALEYCARTVAPTYVEVMIPEMCDMEPPVASWTAALSGIDTARPVY